MLEDLQKKLKGLFGKKSSNHIEDDGDDDILKELGLDDDSLLDDGKGASNKSADFLIDKDASKKKKEKSLFTVAYILLTIAIIFSTGGNAVMYMAANTQENILKSMEDDKDKFTTDISIIRSELEAMNAFDETADVNPNKLYNRLFTERKKVTTIINEFDSLIEYIRDDENIYIAIESFQITAKQNIINFSGFTNSYTNLSKIINIVNESDFFEGVDLNGATKTISADNIPEVPFELSAKVQYNTEEDE